MILSDARKYHAYACECLQLAEKATEPDIQSSLIELSRIWMDAALQEEKRQIELTSGKSKVVDCGAPATSALASSALSGGTIQTF